MAISWPDRAVAPPFKNGASETVSSEEEVEGGEKGR